MLETLAYAVWYATLTAAAILCVVGGSIVGAKLAEEHTRVDGEPVFVVLMTFGWLVVVYYTLLTI